MSPVKLLQIVPGLSGSAARATLDTARLVIGAGGSAAVASPGGTMLPDLLRLRARHVELPVTRHPLRSRFGLAARVRDLDLNLLQSRSPSAAWMARALARRLKLKWVATLHRPFVATGLVQRSVERRQSRADAVIAVSEYVAQDFRRRFPTRADRLETIPSGIDLDRFDPAIVRAERVIKLAADLRIPDGAHVVLYPGRFVEDRGQKTLVDAMKRLDREDLFCLLLGSAGQSTSLEKDLERAIEQAGLNGKVQIGPYVEDMPAAYMLADVVVTTGGARQGFSRTMVEAQAMGRPVVCEQGGGAAEAIREGVTGWLAPERDPSGLAQAISTALSLSVDRRTELARAAQDHARTRYGLAQANRRLLEVFERLIA
ncbi:MAG: glycosyltransferase [Proteobacteria bacterium]|nr:glycosyltransferase [Pseudomonadota bacterium]